VPIKETRGRLEHPDTLTARANLARWPAKPPSIFAVLIQESGARPAHT
jgi:hypothetical protein